MGLISAFCKGFLSFFSLNNLRPRFLKDVLFSASFTFIFVFENYYRQTLKENIDEKRNLSERILPDQESNRGPPAPQLSTLSTKLQPHSFSSSEKLFIKHKNVKNHAADLGLVLDDTCLKRSLVFLEKMDAE